MKIIKEYISHTKKDNYERIYLNPINTQFKIGKKFSYDINFKTKTVKIVPYLNSVRTKGTISRKKSSNGFTPLLDIWNKSILKNVFKNIQECKIVICNDQIIITTPNNKDYRMDIKEFNFFYKTHIQGEFNLVENNDFYTNQASRTLEYLNDKQIIDRIYTFASLFSGMGGFDLGFVNQGFKPYFAIDRTAYSKTKANIEKYGEENCDVLSNYHIETYKANFGNHIVDKNIKEEDFKKVINLFPNNICDVVIGGSPCQNYSVRNLFRNSNPNTPKNLLVFDYMRAVEDLNPNVFILENVQQILTKGKEFIKYMQNKFKEYEFTIIKLNSSDFGMAQKRVRAFVIGSKIGQIIIDNPKIKGVTIKDEFENLDKSIPNQNEYPKICDDIKYKMSLIEPGKDNRSLPKHLRYSYKSLLEKLDWNGQTGTIDNVKKRYLTHPDENRTISVRETMRLQGFPDTFKIIGTLNAKYQMIGNAVPVKLAEGIASSIKKYLDMFYKKCLY